MRGYVGTPSAERRRGVLSIQEHREYCALSGHIIGVQDTGERTVDGAVLRQVILRGSEVRPVSLSAEFFDAHPSYQFIDWVDESDNEFVKIPRCYWFRGLYPDAIDHTTLRWTMLLSHEPIHPFTSNPGAFKRSGVWLDQYYYGKYRGYNAGSSKVGSKPGQSPWGGVSFDNFRTYCANNGTGYHMQSLFEWHEILARCVIERKTFQLVPEADRATPALCVYRGINDFAFGPTSGVYTEWMDGIRTDAYGYYAVWGEAGGTYSGTASAPPLYSAPNYYGQSLRSGGMFDSLFLAAALGPNSTCMIPDLNGGKPATNSNYVCGSNFSGGYGYHGAFNLNFNYKSTDTSATVGSRLAKW